MKRVFTYCLMLSAFAAQAKHNKGKSQSLAMSQPVAARIMAAQMDRSQTAAKTTSVNKRLLSYSYRTFAPAALLDTTTAWYSGNRHSGRLAYRNEDDFNMFRGENLFGAGFLMYDSARNHSGLTGPFALARERFIEYAQDSLISMYKEQYHNNAQQGNYYYQMYYNTAGNVESYEYHQAPAPGSTVYQQMQEVKRFYDAQGNVSVDSFYSYPGGALTFYGLHTYNSSNQETAVVYMELNGSNWDSSSRTTYTYSGALMTGMLSETYVAGVWLPTYSTSMTYDANDRMVTNEFHADFFGAGMEPIGRDSFGYTGNFNSYTYNDAYFWDNGQWMLAGRSTFTLNAAGNHDTVWYYDVDQSGMATILEKDPIYYDADGYITHINGYEYNATTQTYATAPYDENRYWYQVVSNVPSAPSGGDVWTVYPNPASQYLTIKHTSKEPFVATLFNVAGQQVVKQQYQPHGAVQLHTNTLPAGMYILQVSGLNGALLHSQQVVKQ